MFDLEKAVEKKFSSFDETLAFVSEEKRRIVRIPISGLWKGGARFFEDGRFGIGSSFFKFNAYGCKCGTRSAFAVVMEETSNVSTSALCRLATTMVSRRHPRPR
jgi:hypothetical protein